ncbi:hypothetical protein BUALT_Bualt01G0195100 [Buddleja alternifolia]|uniref:Uncharacterized protein n=1 Tax=Buddleja alternifolia TaxID=168488 RepID=A0AAV6Y9G4_9LAMI|nr:hypothetical protein BUALT_Bualt01G0195100 [Buddleja alternifolia]
MKIHIAARNYLFKVHPMRLILQNPLKGMVAMVDLVVLSVVVAEVVSVMVMWEKVNMNVLVGHLIAIVELAAVYVLVDVFFFSRLAEEVVTEGEKPLNVEKPSGKEDAAVDGDKEAATAEVEEKEPENKSVSIKEFLKPAEGERYYSPGGRGRGRGRGGRGGGYNGGSETSNVKAPAPEDPGQFFTLGGK